MADSGFYIGACPDCNTVLNHVHAQNNAQGFSGTNSGGHLVLENSEWDHNQTGILPSSLAIFDLPSPQNGACPGDKDDSCTLIQYNFIHDNNNPNTPASSIAATAPVGTGIDLSGGRNNTVQYNVVVNNGSWGIVASDYGDYSAVLYGVSPAPCTGGHANFTPPPAIDSLFAPPPPGYPLPSGLPIPCYFNAFGNRVTGNVMWGNGSFGNPTNGDLANAAIPYPVNNCFVGNIDLKAANPTSSPANLQDPSVAGVCGAKWNTDTSATSDEFLLTAELGCAALGPASGACTGLPGPGYPQKTQVKMFANPHEEGMEAPCLEVPQNSWCP
jgi:Right handed beta helix region